MTAKICPECQRRFELLEVCERLREENRLLAQWNAELKHSAERTEARASESVADILKVWQTLQQTPEGELRAECTRLKEECNQLKTECQILRANITADTRDGWWWGGWAWTVVCVGWAAFLLFAVVMGVVHAVRGALK